jgi:transcriptional regulator with XRE-family HTH domain
MIATSVQIKAARALLRWSVKDLADKIGIDPSAVTRIEADAKSMSRAAQIRATEVLSAAGIIFLERDDVAGDGVRLATPRVAGVAKQDEGQ